MPSKRKAASDLSQPYSNSVCNFVNMPNLMTAKKGFLANDLSVESYRVLPSRWYLVAFHCDVVSYK